MHIYICIYMEHMRAEAFVVQAASCVVCGNLFGRNGRCEMRYRRENYCAYCAHSKLPHAARFACAVTD